jgi:hypothetical protein
VGVLTGAFGNEHANRPELTNDELFDAIDRIVKVCNSDHDKVQGMLDELHRWQYGEAEVELSKGLNEIIEQVKIRK